jgi:ABC-type antimicrobial peptide transport system permease subunit
MRDIVRQIDAAMPVFSVRTMDSLYQARGLEVPNVLIGAVLGMVLRRALLLTGLGLVLGTAGAAAAARGLQVAIPQIGNFNPLLFVSVVAALLGVSMLAAYAPARRAARVDPLRALRTE